MGYKLKTLQQIQKIQLNAYRKLAESIGEKIEDVFNHIVSDAMLDISNADAVSFYIKRDDVLEFIIMKTKSMEFSAGGIKENITLPPMPLFDKDGNPHHSSLVAHSVNTQKTVNIKDVYKVDDKVLDFSGAKNFDKKTGYKTKSVLVMPIKDYQGNIQGVIQMINAQDFETGGIIEFNKQMVDDLENFTTQVGSYMNQRKLLKDMENLFEALIKLIAKAIDKKSHYTGKHCERVPVLAAMISSELCKQKEGHFKNFTLNKDEENELRIAAWLHDTGKIATPPHVNDKATKLERIIDGIELIEHRIEILKKNAEIDFLKQKLDFIKRGDEKEIGKAKSLMDKKIQLYDESIKLIYEVNMGGEYLEKEKINQIKNAYNEQLMVNGKSLNLLDDYEKNVLSIKRGTLDDNERNKINEHVSITYELLNEIPFPSKLRNVPTIAANHHEKLDGSGYPFRKKAKDLSVQSRILGFADIFEALTASDRPYKKANTLRESLDIMYEMCNRGKIDKEIFKVFLNKKIYMKYAKKHIDKNQIDEIDSQNFLFS